MIICECLQRKRTCISKTLQKRRRGTWKDVTLQQSCIKAFCLLLDLAVETSLPLIPELITSVKATLQPEGLVNRQLKGNAAVLKSSRTQDFGPSMILCTGRKLFQHTFIVRMISKQQSNHFCLNSGIS